MYIIIILLITIMIKYIYLIFNQKEYQEITQEKKNKEVIITNQILSEKQIKINKKKDFTNRIKNNNSKFYFEKSKIYINNENENINTQNNNSYGYYL